MAARCQLLVQSVRVIVAALVVMLPAFAAPAPAQAAQVTAAGQAAAGTVPVLDVVMLVDESGSETPASISDERQAAETIAQSMLSPRSRVTVVGFGGVNNVVPDQNPINVICQPTIAGGVTGLNYLSSCVNGLHRRTEAEGDDTDYAAALAQAMGYFNPATTFGQQSPAGATKVILMMTDGSPDVHGDTQQYGTDWQLGEQTAVNQQLALARKYGVQVWPLGFGADITTEAKAYLNTLAAHGAQRTCGGQGTSQAHATVVLNDSELIAAVDQVYASAVCLGSSSEPVTALSGSQSVLTVKIPVSASNATITVDRGNPGIQVSFTTPDGKLWTDSSAISGLNSPVEVLHVADITSGEVGTWHIQLTGPPGLASQPVSATVFWQGAVRAVITADPPSASPGQRIDVVLSLLGRNGPITDPSVLAKLHVRVSVSGDGLTAATQVPMTNTGETSGQATGEYTGSFTAPSENGTLTLTGSTAGDGLSATEVPATVQVGAAIPGFTATAQLPVVSGVQAGQGIQGAVRFTNQTGAARRMRLELGTSHAFAAITSPVSPITAEPGRRSLAVPFTITFARNSPAGQAWLEIKVVDAADPGLVYDVLPIDVTVTKAPGLLAEDWWKIIALALVIAAILSALWMRAARRRNVDVRGLIAVLRRNGELVGTELEAPDEPSETFRFIIRDEEQPTARLEYPQPGFPAYQVSRAENGGVRLITPDGKRYDHVVVGGPGEHLDRNGLELAFRDGRPRRVTRRLTFTNSRSQPTSVGPNRPQGPEDDLW